jgi:hypothetical protein
MAPMAPMAPASNAEPDRTAEGAGRVCDARPAPACPDLSKGHDAGTAALEFTNNGILHSTPTSPRAHTLPNLPEHGALAKSKWARVVTREIRELIAREWRHMLGQRERRDSG